MEPSYPIKVTKKRHWLHILFIIVLVALAILPNLIPINVQIGELKLGAGEANATNWFPGWAYQKSKTIEGNGTSAGTISVDPGLLSFTQWTQVDAGTYIAQSGNKIDFTALTRQTTKDSYVYLDCGLQRWATDYEFELTIYCTSADSGGVAYVWALDNALGDAYANRLGDNHNLMLGYNGTNYYLTLRERIAGAATSDTYLAAGIANLQPCYIRIWRTSSVGTYGTLYCDIYSTAKLRAAGDSGDLDRLIVTLTEDENFEYLYVSQSYCDDTSSPYPTITGYVQDLRQITPTLGREVVFGSSTAFGKWNPMDEIQLPDNNWYTIDNIYANTELYIDTKYPAAAATGQNYAMRHRLYTMVPLTLHYGSGSDDNTNIYLNSHCQADFDDIRFSYDSAGETLLYASLISKVDSNNAVVNIKVATIPESGSSTTIYVWYGNPDCGSLWSGGTYHGYDDFELGNDEISWQFHASNPIIDMDGQAWHSRVVYKPSATYNPNTDKYIVFYYGRGYPNTYTNQVSTKDTFIDQSAGDNNVGADTYLALRALNTYAHRIIIEFDISDLEGTAGNATLGLYINSLTGASGGTVYCNRIDHCGAAAANAWVEGTGTIASPGTTNASWNHYLATTHWTDGGGDFTTTDRVSTTMPAAGNWMEFDVTALVKDAISYRSDVLDLLIKFDVETSGSDILAWINSSEHGTTANRPKLTISYATDTDENKMGRTISDSNDPMSTWTDDASNPVFSTGSGTGVGSPAIAYYNGYLWCLIPFSITGNIHLLKSTEANWGAAGTWVDQGEVFDHAVSGWDSLAIDTGCLLPPNITPDGKWWFYYTGWSGDLDGAGSYTTNVSFGLATSDDDLVTLDRYAGNPILVPSQWHNAQDRNVLGRVSVFPDAMGWNAFYNVCYRVGGSELNDLWIHYAATNDITDAINFKAYSAKQPIIDSVSGTWEDGYTIHPSFIYKENDKTNLTGYLFYVGECEDPYENTIGVAKQLYAGDYGQDRGARGWYVGSGTGTMAVQGTTKYEGSYALQFDNLDAASYKPMRRTEYLTNFTADFYIRVDSTNEFSRFGFGSTSLIAARVIAFNSTGHFCYYSGSAWTNLETDTTYSANTWYKITVVFRTIDQQFDIYINDVLKGDNLWDTGMTGNVVGYFTSQIGSSGSTPIVYLDRFSIRRSAATEPTWGTAGAETINADVTTNPSSKALGTVYATKTYYSYGGLTAPSFPLEDGNCTFETLNNSTYIIDITAKAVNFTGGVTIALTSSSPGENQIRLTLLETGVGNPTGGTVLTTSAQTFINDIGIGSHTHWELKMELGAYTDSENKTGNITLETMPVGDIEVIPITFTTELPDIAGLPASKDFNTVVTNSIYWAIGAEPGWPLASGNCTGNITNEGTLPIDISFSMGNMTGGSQWTIGGSPSIDIFTVKTCISGAFGTGDCVTLAETPQELIHSLSGGSTEYYEFVVYTPTWYSDLVEKSGNMTLTASVP